MNNETFLKKLEEIHNETIANKNEKEEIDNVVEQIQIAYNETLIGYIKKDVDKLKDIGFIC